MYHHSARGRKPMRCTRGACATGIFGLVCLLLPAPYLLPRLLACRLPPTQEAPTVPYFHAPAPLFPQATHLIMVAGHAVLTASTRRSTTVTDEKSWYLEPFQHGQLATMLAHIKRGIELAAADNDSLLVFSGGETRAAAGPRSEASSYWEAAEALDWYGHAHVRPRAILEANARDSLENLLFAICRFREVSGSYPTRVTVVSFGFKRHRFTELHRHALRYPRSKFSYLGLDPPNLGLDVLRGELQHSSKPFEQDPYGCAEETHGPGVLRHKRASRNPFRRREGYRDSCPELQGLLAYCGRARYAGALPWSSEVGDDEDERRRTVP